MKGWGAALDGAALQHGPGLDLGAGRSVPDPASLTFCITTAATASVWSVQAKDLLINYSIDR